MDKNIVAVRGIITRRLLDRNGKPVKMFRENRFWEFLKDKFNLDLKIPFVTGNWTLKPIVHNALTETALAKFAGLILGEDSDYINYLALGTGTASASGLQSEITTGGGERALGTLSLATVVITNDAAQVLHEWTFTSDFALTEEGLFNAASAGDLIAYRNMSAVNVSSGMKFEVTHQIQFVIPA